MTITQTTSRKGTWTKKSKNYVTVIEYLRLLLLFQCPKESHLCGSNKNDNTFPLTNTHLHCHQMSPVINVKYLACVLCIMREGGLNCFSSKFSLNFSYSCFTCSGLTSHIFPQRLRQVKSCTIYIMLFYQQERGLAGLSLDDRCQCFQKGYWIPTQASGRWRAKAAEN